MDKEHSANRRRNGLTLIELLVVVVIIALLVAMLWPAINPGHRYPFSAVAKTEMKGLVTALSQYEADNELIMFESNQEGDVTCGLKPSEIQGFVKIDGTQLISSNSDFMNVIMDLDSGINTGHVKNPRRHRYFEPKIALDPKGPGYSTTDHQYRDPWGNPYVISLDANGDGRVRDAVYANASLCANDRTGMQVNSNGISEVKGSIMVWSRGPDGKVGMDAKDKDGVNKDNVVSWR